MEIAPWYTDTNSPPQPPSDDRDVACRVPGGYDDVYRFKRLPDVSDDVSIIGLVFPDWVHGIRVAFLDIEGMEKPS